MRILKSTLSIFIIILAIWTTPLLAAQHLDLSSTSFPASTMDDGFRARELTRFHVTTLKAFHSELFDAAENSSILCESDASLLNTALDTFLTLDDRASLLLAALREDKAVRLTFSVKEKTEDYEMVKDPSQELLFRFEPKVSRVPVSVDIRPMLDGPIAFEITLAHDSDSQVYFVDWAGKFIG